MSRRLDWLTLVVWLGLAELLLAFWVAAGWGAWQLWTWAT